MKANRIIWTVRAELDYVEIIEYLQNEWSIKVVQGFDKKVEYVLNLILANPNLFKETNHRNTRKAFINKSISLIYKLDEDSIILLKFWNNRRDPEFMLG